MTSEPGNHRTELRFDRRLGALLGGSRRPLKEQIESGTPCLPAGCHFELDAQAREHILANLAANIPARRTALASALRTRPDDEGLADFLEATGASLERVYAGAGSTWSSLREQAGKGVLATGPKDWESPSDTRADGASGKRCREHAPPPPSGPFLGGGVLLAQLLPLDKARNAEGIRRALPVGRAPEPRTPTGLPPLLRSLLADYEATGFPPAYLPRGEGETTTKGTEETESR